MTDSPTERRASGLLREPLLWFAVLGAGLFWINARFGADDVPPVVVNDAIRSRLADQWQAQMGQAPSTAELQGLIDGWIKEEVYAREAAAMGLDRDDTIIRRRLVQKLTFLTEDQATITPPDPETLRAYYQNNLAAYAEPARYSFEHIYFNADRRSNAEADAAAVLEQLQAAAEPSANADDAGELAQGRGDPFMLQRQFAGRSARQVGDLFGAEFAEALVALPERPGAAGSWHGPIKSAYGVHLARITGIVPARTQSFDEASARIAIDYGQNRRQEASEAFYEALRDRYPVVVEPAATPGAAGS
jgi:hypothetical protein